MLSLSKHSIRLIKHSFSQQVNYYYILGVKEQATQQQIKARYYKLAKIHHPDSTQSKGNTQFIRIKQAYNIIGNVQSRATYDRKLRRQQDKQRERQHSFYQSEIHEKYSYGSNSKSNKSHKKHQYVVRLGLLGICCSALYFMFGFQNKQSGFQVRKNNMILRRENVNSTTGVIEKRRKLLEEQRKQKQFQIVPITIHFDAFGNAYTNQQNIKPHKRRGSSKKNKKTKQLEDMPNIRKKHPKTKPAQRQFQGEYI